MKRYGGIMAAVVAVLLGAGTARALEPIESQTLSPRLWYVDWQFGPEDLGSAPFVMLNWNVQFTKWHFQVLAGYGEGWESDFITDDEIAGSVEPPDPTLLERRKRDDLKVTSRMDLQWQLARKFSLEGVNRAFNLPWAPGTIYAGAAYHYVEFDFDAPLGSASYFYHGPEALIGLTQPFLADGLSLRLSATWLPYAWLTGEASEFFGTASETTDGYQYDAGFAYATGDGPPVHFAAGYRALTMNAKGFFEEDQFDGFYVEVGVRF